EGQRYPMTYIKGHKDKGGGTYFEKLHTYINFPKESKTPERTGYLVKSSDKHKSLIKRGFSILEYGKHDDKTTHYTMPVTITKDLNEDAQQTYLTKFDPREKPGYSSDKQIPNVLILKRKAIRVFPDHQKVALYYAQAIDKYISVPFGISGETGIPTMFREEVSAQYKQHKDDESSSISSKLAAAKLLKKKKKPVSQQPNTSVPTVKKKGEQQDYFAGGGWSGIGHAIGLAAGNSVVKPTKWVYSKVKERLAAKAGSPVPADTVPPETGEPVVTTGAKTATKSFSRSGIKVAPAKKPPASAHLPPGK